MSHPAKKGAKTGDNITPAEFLCEKKHRQKSHKKSPSGSKRYVAQSPHFT
jgi:hypothetical protein